jgi:hypothetical protein
MNALPAENPSTVSSSIILRTLSKITSTGSMIIQNNNLETKKTAPNPVSTAKPS